jgi:hypothetical protein
MTSARVWLLILAAALAALGLLVASTFLFAFIDETDLSRPLPKPEGLEPLLRALGPGGPALLVLAVLSLLVPPLALWHQGRVARGPATEAAPRRLRRGPGLVQALALLAVLVGVATGAWLLAEAVVLVLQHRRETDPVELRAVLWALRTAFAIAGGLAVWSGLLAWALRARGRRLARRLLRGGAA